MVDNDRVRFVVGVIGNVISFFLFLSPSPTMWNIIKQKSVQHFKVDPYVATWLNCAMWVFYGMLFVNPDSLLVVTINGTGLGIQSIYIIIFIFSIWIKRRNILIILTVEVIFLVAIILIAMLAIRNDIEHRGMLVGILCCIFNIAMYSAPLTAMRRVIRTKSVKYMPFWLALASFVNGIVWMTYALLKFDPYILVPNIIGTLAGATQLILYVLYYKTTNWDSNDQDDQNKTEVEMADNNNNNNTNCA